MKMSKKVLSILLSVLMIALTASCLSVCFPVSAVEVGDTIQFGTYPQTKVNETTALKKAADDAVWKSYDYYTGYGRVDGQMYYGSWMQFADFFSGNVKYRAVKFTRYRPDGTNYPGSQDASNQDENGYFIDTTYYFKYEPLTWRVLDPSTGYIMCENLIDAQSFQNVVIDYGNGQYGNNIELSSASDYAKSSIRSWLNNDFYETAFTAGQKSKIKDTNIDTDAYVYGSSSRSFKVDNEYTYTERTVQDKIYLLSAPDIANSAYGFPVDITQSSTRIAEGTDYAKCQGLMVFENGKSYWWLRSPSSSGFAWHVYVFGDVTNEWYTVCHTEGVRPACCLSNLASDTTVSSDLYSGQNFTVTLSTSSDAGGSVTGAGVYAKGETATVTATPNSGYLFQGWYKNNTRVSTSKSYTFTVTANVTLTARFEAGYTVTINNDPKGGGTVNAGANCSPGSTYTAVATPNPDCSFVGWLDENGTTVSTSQSYIFTVNSDVTLTAKFARPTYTVIVTIDPDGANGHVFGNYMTYEAGSKATVSCAQDDNLEGWYIDGVKVSSEKSYSFTITQTTYIVVKFSRVTHTVTLTASPAKGGSVEGSGTYDHGARVTLKAIPAEGYNFDGWYKNDTKVSTDENYTIQTNSDSVYVAKFVRADGQPDDPEDPTDPGTDDPTPSEPENVCPWCGGQHEGFFQGIIGFFHRIFAKLFGAKY